MAKAEIRTERSVYELVCIWLGGDAEIEGVEKPCLATFEEARETTVILDGCRIPVSLIAEELHDTYEEQTGNKAKGGYDMGIFHFVWGDRSLPLRLAKCLIGMNQRRGFPENAMRTSRQRREWDAAHMK